jgi:hypothetical protein
MLPARYMNAGTWADAVTAAQAVISLNKYGIYTGGYNNLFLVNETNETIFERLYTKNDNHTHLEIANGPNGYGGWAGNTPLQNLVDDYEMDNGKPITDPTSGYDAILMNTATRALLLPYYTMALYTETAMLKPLYRVAKIARMVPQLEHNQNRLLP